jgi:hypothetical protein
MAVDFKTFLSVVPHIINARFPVLVRGRHGIGKSTVVYQLADSLSLPVVERRASQMTEGDLLGLPKVEGNVTQWLAPEWLHRACNEPVVLFLDEVDRATMEVRQGIFELCDSRKIAGYELHKDTVIFAAVNGGQHGAQYQVGEMDLEHNDDFEPNKVYPSRRSWERLSKTLQSMGTPIESSTTLYQLACAFIGFEGAVAFNDFMKNYERQVTVEDILDKGKLELTKDWKINDHNSLIEKFKAKEVFNEKLSDNRLQNLANYFVTLPSEIAMTLWQVMGTTDFATYNVAKLHNLKASNGTVVQEFIVEILTAK